ncbi:MAG: hypothetical protein ACYS19_05610, partial [Planctomycetota bacterium]
MRYGKNYFFRNISVVVLIVCVLITGSKAVGGSASRTKPPIPRPEHPRPQFQRDAWINLNGQWDFEVDLNVVGIRGNWQNNSSRFSKKITVPFCVESELSGIG